jgi:hypothetical protein
VDSDRLNRWLTLGANIGVVIGIILLIVELDQNRDMMRAQTRNDLASEIVGLLSETSFNSEISSILVRCENGEELTDTEAFQYRLRTNALFRYFENVHYQYRQGLYDQSEYETQRIAWRGALSSMRAAESWCAYRSSISAEARAAVDELVPHMPC